VRSKSIVSEKLRLVHERHRDAVVWLVTQIRRGRTRSRWERHDWLLRVLILDCLLVCSVD
jgi:hypothetical protein